MRELGVIPDVDGSWHSYRDDGGVPTPGHPDRTEFRVNVEINPHVVVHAILASEYDLAEDSIDIVRETRSGNDAAVAVTFRERDGTQRRGFIGLSRDCAGSWRPSGQFMDSTHETGSKEVFATYGGWGAGGSKVHAVFGGWAADPSAVSARLIDPVSGDVIEDRVMNGVVIFMSEGEFPLRHARIELLDSAQQVLRTAPAQRSSRR